MERNEIYQIQGRDYKQMTLDILKASDLAGDIGDKNKYIGIKPNLVIAARADGGAVTHPQIVDGVLTYLKENGFNKIVVLEGSWVGDRTAEAVRVSGILDVCKKHDVRFFDMQRDSHSKKTERGITLNICDEALKLDYLINLPVLKGHCQTYITCALKNMKGLIPNSEKRRFHTMGLHKPIAYLNAVLHQDFILVDNICGDLDFEEGGNPVTMNRLMTFKDPVLCDSFTAQTMGYDPYKIEYIEIAEKLGVGSSDTSKAIIHDLSPEGSKDKKLNPRGKVKTLSQYVNAEDACSACYGSLIYALDRLSDKGKLKKLEKSGICIGQAYKGQPGKLGVGNCTKCFDQSVAGCPPKAIDIMHFLEENM